MPLKNRDELLRLVNARHPGIAITTAEEQYALSVVREAALESRRTLFLWDCVRGLRDGLIADAAPLPDTKPAGGALAWVESHLKGDGLFCFLDLAEPLDKDAACRRIFRDALLRVESGGGSIVLIGYDEPPPFAGHLLTTHTLAYAGEKELEILLRDTVREHHRTVRPVQADLRASELKAIVSNLRGLTRRQAKRAIVDAIALDQRLDGEDVQSVLRHKKRSLSSVGLLEFVEAPTDLNQIGGLAKLKQWLQRRAAGGTQRARDFGLEPARGLLLLGVQGAGKSLASKPVATAWQRPLLRLDVGALYDRYIGESEKRLRGALRQAEMMSPCVLWIDEIEKAFAGAAAQSNDGGLSRRMFGSLLTWMQERAADVFLIATANDVSALPPELLRKGRFDEIFFVDLPGDDARRAIFAIHIERRHRDPQQFDLDKLVAASAGHTGAEIEQAIIAALHDAFALGGELTTDGILATLAASPPLSVTRREQIAELRNWADGRCVPAE